MERNFDRRLLAASCLITDGRSSTYAVE